MGKHSPILTAGIALVFLVTLTSVLHNDSTEIDFLLPHHGFENVDQECSVIYDVDSFNRLGLAFFFILPELISTLLEELPCSSFKVPTLYSKSPVLRC